MALQNSKTGTYIKVILDRCSFRPNSVEVAYYEFENKADRDAYFKREKEIKDFGAKCDLKFAVLEKEVVDAVLKGKVDGTKVTKLTDLPKGVQKLVLASEAFVSDSSKIRFGWDKEEPLPSEYQSQKLLDECGFNFEWLKPLRSHGINYMSTGIFTNQTFSMDCLYKELKKVFKTDFIDV